MTLANKVHCNEDHFHRYTRSDGMEFLFLSQMKNNDREFNLVVDKLKHQIPNEQVDKYALRRTKSNYLYR